MPSACRNLAVVTTDRAFDWDGWRRDAPTPAQQRNDIMLAGLVVAGAVTATVLINSMGAFVFGTAPALAEQLAWGVALTAPLAVRRRQPKAVLAPRRRISWIRYGWSPAGTHCSHLR
jgi:hypothetical protein